MDDGAIDRQTGAEGRLQHFQRKGGPVGPWVTLMRRNGFALLCVLIAGNALAQEASPVLVRVPLDQGELDVGRLIEAIANEAALPIKPPAVAIRFPVVGPSGALARTMLANALGPEATFDVKEDALIVRVDPTAIGPDVLRARLAALAEAAGREANRRRRFGMHALPSYRPNDPERPTICLVHGMNSSSGSFVHMLRPLEDAGFGLVVYEFPYNRDLDETAPGFARDWASFRRKQGDARPWAILTHSMGALLARHYVEGEHYQGDVSSLVLIAPPNQGSAVAQAQTVLQWLRGLQSVNGKQAGPLASLSDGLGEAADDMVPGSSFLKALNAQGRRDGVRYHVLAGDRGFLTAEGRRQVESRLGLLTSGGGALGKLGRLATSDLSRRLDEVADGTGDGCVAVASTRLAGVDDHVVLHANHVELIRGPLLYPDPGPVASMPFVLDRLAPLRNAPATIGEKRAP